MQNNSRQNREFILTDSDFHTLQRLVNLHTGISVSDAKRELIYSRLTRRLRTLKINSFSRYCRLLEENSDTEELTQFKNAVTTNLTSFFREPYHFEFLKKNIFSKLGGKSLEKEKLRIWSAGCSTGEEPYSIAMTLEESLSSYDKHDIKILATDLDSNVLETARQGIYHLDKLKTLPKYHLHRAFVRHGNRHMQSVLIKPELKKLITFKQLNLMHEWPMKGPFDFIFCRNVVIYFDKDTQRILIDRFANLLKDGGYLFLGHSESLFRVTDRFKLEGQTVYRKIK